MTWDETPANPALDEDLNRTLRSPAPESLAAGVAARLVLARAARHRRLRHGAIAAGLTIVVLMAGFLARPAPVPAPTHLLVIQEPLADRLTAPDEERQRRGREFGAWIAGLRARGLLAGGHQLRADGGHLISAAGVDDRSRGVPAGEVISGFLLLRAPDEGVAIRAARECPILLHGGRVILRRLAQ
jgi:hypothetical protein